MLSINPAKYFYNSLKDQLRYYRNKWYHFKGQIWTELKDYQLHRLIDEQIIEFRLELGLGADQKQLSKIIEFRRRWISSNFRNKTTKEMSYLFYTEEKFNQNKTLIACLNGVLDFANGIFRPGVPDDYLSIQSNIRYQKYQPNSPEVIVFSGIMTQIFPEESNRDQFYQYVIDCFQGKAPRAIVHYGEPNSGKTMVLGFLLSLFGDYATTFNQNDKSNLENIRLVVSYEEPKDGLIFDNRDFTGTVMAEFETLPVNETNRKIPMVHYQTRFTQPDFQIRNKLNDLKSAALWFLFNLHCQKFNFTYQAQFQICLKELLVLPPRSNFPGGVEYFHLRDRFNSV